MKRNPGYLSALLLAASPSPAPPSPSPASDGSLGPLLGLAVIIGLGLAGTLLSMRLRRDR